MATLLLSVIGDDRPGLVSSLASTLAAHGAGWERSRLAHLSGKFAGILEVIVPEERVDELSEACRGLAERGLSVTVERTEAPEPEPGRSLTLELVGADRPGIVAEISGVLAARGVNVEELNTTVRPAPMSGGLLFEARAALWASSDTSTDELRAAVESLADELLVEVTVSET